MSFEMKRIIYFVNDMPKMKAFYGEVLGLAARDPDNADEWQEFEAGPVTIALHKAFDPEGKPASYNKVCFYSSDVASVHEQLVLKGVKMRGVQTFGELKFSDGEDPEGNTFQISNR